MEAAIPAAAEEMSVDAAEVAVSSELDDIFVIKKKKEQRRKNMFRFTSDWLCLELRVLCRRLEDTKTKSLLVLRKLCIFEIRVSAGVGAPGRRLCHRRLLSLPVSPTQTSHQQPSCPQHSLGQRL